MEYSRKTNNLIAALRGLPEDHNVSKLRPAFALGNLIEVLEQRYKIGQERVEITIAKHWKEIVGEKCAHRCSPKRLTAGNAVLVIQLSNPVLRSEMQFKKREILDRIHLLPGGGVVKELHLIDG